MRAPVLRGTEMSDITLEDGVRLLAERAAKPAAKKKSSKTKAAIKKKPTAKKKASAKKAVAKKKAAPKA
jgi:topoisomerase IA-like protein